MTGTYFEASNNLTVGEGHEHGRHVSITCRRDKTATELVAGSSIKPRGNSTKSAVFQVRPHRELTNDEIGIKIIRDG